MAEQTLQQGGVNARTARAAQGSNPAKTGLQVPVPNTARGRDPLVPSYDREFVEEFMKCFRLAEDAKRPEPRLAEVKVLTEPARERLQKRMELKMRMMFEPLTERNFFAPGADFVESMVGFKTLQEIRNRVCPGEPQVIIPDEMSAKFDDNARFNELLRRGLSSNTLSVLGYEVDYAVYLNPAKAERLGLIFDRTKVRTMPALEGIASWPGQPPEGQLGFDQLVLNYQVLERLRALSEGCLRQALLDIEANQDWGPAERREAAAVVYADQWQSFYTLPKQIFSVFRQSLHQAVVFGLDGASALTPRQCEALVILLGIKSKEASRHGVRDLAVYRNRIQSAMIQEQREGWLKFELPKELENLDAQTEEQLSAKFSSYGEDGAAALSFFTAFEQQTIGYQGLMRAFDSYLAEYPKGRESDIAVDLDNLIVRSPEDVHTLLIDENEWFKACERWKAAEDKILWNMQAMLPAVEQGQNPVGIFLQNYQNENQNYPDPGRRQLVIDRFLAQHLRWFPSAAEPEGARASELEQSGEKKDEAGGL